MTKIGIVDGDVLCYGACDGPWRKKLEYWKKCGLDTDELKGLRTIPGYLPDKDPEMFEQCWRAFKELLKTSLEAAYCDDHVMAVKHGKSYRDDIYCDYKRDRGKWSIYNPFVQMVRNRAVEEGLSIFATDKEADDLIRMWAEEFQKYEIDHVIISVDKDLWCIPGLHFNPKKKTFKNITLEEGMWHYYGQLLSGDPTDFIPGLPGIGPKTAMEMIEGLPTEEDCQEVVVSMYISKFEDNWLDYLLSNGKMIHIQRSWNDHFVVRDWPIVRELV